MHAYIFSSSRDFLIFHCLFRRFNAPTPDDHTREQNCSIRKHGNTQIKTLVADPGFERAQDFLSESDFFSDLDQGNAKPDPQPWFKRILGALTVY